MKTVENVLASDVLVFSAHKTATQTIKRTLIRNDITCVHCHHLSNIDTEWNEFRSVLKEYKKRHGKPLTIISVFREPVDRAMSSFFQTYGWKPIGSGELSSEKETIIYRYSIGELQKRFMEEVNAGQLKGRKEPILELSSHLDVPMSRLMFDPVKKMGKSELQQATIYLFRFDQLVLDFSGILSRAIGRNLVVHKKNATDDKWYNQKYRDFKSTISFPRQVIDKIYNPKMLNLAAKMYCEDEKKFIGKIKERYCHDPAQ